MNEHVISKYIVIVQLERGYTDLSKRLVKEILPIGETLVNRDNELQELANNELLMFLKLRVA